jgi:hypothetical protein
VLDLDIDGRLIINRILVNWMRRRGRDPADSEI